MKAIVVVPARLGSTRLPRKVLRELAGRPMLEHVVRAATGCAGLADVVVATDAEEVMDLCHQRGWHGEMTSPDCRNGTERVREVAQRIAADVYINIQGDEPLARAEQVATLLALMQDAKIEVGTLKTPCPPHDVANPHAVKVVTDASGRALYFSRATIPYDRDAKGEPRYFKHLGFYAYRGPALDSFVKLPESSLERSERLEQLRFLENGIAIHVAETPFETVGVDTEEDLKRADGLLRARK